MDSSSPPPNNPQHHNYTSYDNNWLAFSLNPSPDLSLFHPFFPPPPSPGNNFPQEQDATAAAVGGAAGDYTTPGPKLENFLGGSVIYPGGPGPDASAAFYGTKRAEAVGAGLMHGFITAPPEEYINTMNHHKQQQDPPLEVLASETPPPPLLPSGPKKAGDSFGHRTSIYRGVTRHRWTGRYEAHLWDNSCKREGQSRKGRQVYLGGYDKEEKAARAYDLAALKYWGATTTTNFPVLDYEKELEEMKHMSRQEFVASLRRKSSGFSRGASIYRGVTRHHQHGRWQARIGRVAGNKDLYLGTFSTQEEAAEAYDIAAIKFRGGNAVTNFDISRYDVKSIANNNLPVGGLSNKSSKAATSSSSSLSGSFDNNKNVLGGTVQYHFPTSSTTLSFATDPTEQQTLCWPHHHEQTSPEFNMDASGGGSFFGYEDHPQTTTATTPTTSCADVSFAVPMSSSGSGGDGGRTCAAKANLSALHTLIFGME